MVHCSSPQLRIFLSSHCFFIPSCFVVVEAFNQGSGREASRWEGDEGLEVARRNMSPKEKNLWFHRDPKLRQPVRACVRVHFSCFWLYNPMDCSPPVSSFHGILQARILEWVAVPSSRGSSEPRFFTIEPPEKPKTTYRLIKKNGDDWRVGDWLLGYIIVMVTMKMMILASLGSSVFHNLQYVHASFPLSLPSFRLWPISPADNKKYGWASQLTRLS